MPVVVTEVPASCPVGKEQAAGSAGSVLVVDDSAVDRRLAAHVVQKVLGFPVRYARHGREALKEIERELPLVVLTDIIMPHMDGLELVAEVRDRYPTLPVILMTAQGSEVIAGKALLLGAASYVRKHCLTEELPGVLQRVLDLTREERRRQRFMEGISHLECQLALENDAGLVSVFVAHVLEVLTRMGLCEANDRIRIGIALEEAMLNGMHHGNLELDSSLREGEGDKYRRLGEERRLQAPYRDRRLHISYRLSPDEAVFVLRDEGPGFDVSRIPDPTEGNNLLKLSGRGLMLMRLFMDEVRHNACGNEVTLIRRRRKSL